MREVLGPWAGANLSLGERETSGRPVLVLVSR